MLKTLTMILLFSTTIAFMGDDTVAQDKPLSKHERCATYGQLAGVVMELRQKGVPMSQVMSIAAKSDSAGFYAFAETVIREAYDHRQHYTDDAKLDAVQRFRNAIEAACYSAR